MSTITTQPTTAQLLRQKQIELDALVRSNELRKTQRIARHKALVEQLPKMFEVSDIREVIKIIKEHGGVSLRAVVTPAKEAAIIADLRDPKKTAADIATAHGVSIPTVHVIRQRAKIKGRERGRPSLRKAA